MTKERRNITISSDVNDYLSDDHVNASGLIEQLVRTYMNNPNVDTAADITTMQLEKAREHTVADAADTLLGGGTERKHPDGLSINNAAVRVQARKLDMPAAVLIEEIKEHEQDK